MRIDRPIYGCVLAACLFTLGCASFDLRRAIPWGEGADGQIKQPMRVVAMWTDTVMHRDLVVPVRGFGGRLMFYEAGSTKPIKVAGSLEVYAFDEVGRDPLDVEPDRKFVFTAEQFEQHYSKGTLGHSYSFWIPWDQAGGEQKEISLIARFTPENAAPIAGEPARFVLHGPPPKEVAKREPRRPRFGRPDSDLGVRQAAYDRELSSQEYEGETAAAEGQPDKKSRLSTATIELPARFGQGPPIAVVRRQSTDASGGEAVNAAAPSGNATADATSSQRTLQGAGQRSWAPPVRARTRMRPIGGPLEPLPRTQGEWNRSGPTREVVEGTGAGTHSATTGGEGPSSGK